MTEVCAYRALRGSGGGAAAEQLVVGYSRPVVAAAGAATTSGRVPTPLFASLSAPRHVGRGEPAAAAGSSSRPRTLELLPAYEVTPRGKRGRQYVWDGRTVRLVEDDEARARIRVPPPRSAQRTLQHLAY